jgi:hypothetical protein
VIERLIAHPRQPPHARHMTQLHLNCDSCSRPNTQPAATWAARWVVTVLCSRTTHSPLGTLHDQGALARRGTTTNHT